MVAQLEDFDPEWENRERGECEALSAEITALTARKGAAELSAAAVQAKRDGMLAGIEGLKQARACRGREGRGRCGGVLRRATGGGGFRACLPGAGPLLAHASPAFPGRGV